MLDNTWHKGYSIRIKRENSTKYGVFAVYTPVGSGKKNRRRFP